jgi:hypothetical protein
MIVNTFALCCVCYVRVLVGKIAQWYRARACDRHVVCGEMNKKLIVSCSGRINMTGNYEFGVAVRRSQFCLSRGEDRA